VNMRILIPNACLWVLAMMLLWAAPTSAEAQGTKLINPSDAFSNAFNNAQAVTDSSRRQRALNELAAKYGPEVYLFAAPQTARSYGGTTGAQLIFGGMGHAEFLGCLNCSQLDPSSISNRVSQFGWSNPVGLWSKIGQYASVVGSQSACNRVATDPPVIVTEQGEFLGRLSVSPVIRDGVCTLNGGNICAALTAMCVGR
jgi:hypothetical protein